MPYKTIQSPVQSPVATTEETLTTQQRFQQLEARLKQLEVENQQLRSIDSNVPDAPDAEISPVQTPKSMNREDNVPHPTSLNNNMLFAHSYHTLEESSNTSIEAEKKSCCDDECINDCGNLIMCTAGCCEIASACCECIGFLGSCITALS